MNASFIWTDSAGSDYPFVRPQAAFAVCGVRRGVVAILMARLDAAAINTHFFEGINMMKTMTVPIIYASSAGMIAKAGCIRAVVNLANQLSQKNRRWGLWLYGAAPGDGYPQWPASASNSIVIAPLVFAAFGCIPEVIAGLTIATAAMLSHHPGFGPLGHNRPVCRDRYRGLF